MTARQLQQQTQRVREEIAAIQAACAAYRREPEACQLRLVALKGAM